MRVTMCLVLAGVLCFSGDLPTAGETVEGVPALWTKPGTEWYVHIRQYSRGWAVQSSNPEINEEAQKPKIQCEFHMHITVLEPQGEDDTRVARILFTPMDDAPDFVRGGIRVLELDAATGKVKAIKIRTDEKGGGEKSVATIGQEQVLFAETYGFPVDWIVSGSDVALRPTREEDRSLLNKEGDSFIRKLRPAMAEGGRDPAVEIETATSWCGREPRARIVQTWVPGEGWWRSFTRYLDGHIDLEATLVERKKE